MQTHLLVPLPSPFLRSSDDADSRFYGCSPALLARGRRCVALVFGLVVSLCSSSACGPGDVNVEDGGRPTRLDGGVEDAGIDLDAGDQSDAGGRCTCPPRPSACASGTEILRYVAAGCDDTGACVYETDTEVCDAPPPSTCTVDGRLDVFDPVGACEIGECLYAPSSQSCDTPPEPACIDGQQLRSFDASGTCEGDSCVYPPVVTDCALGCCTDHCCGGLPSQDTWGALADNGFVVGPPSGQFDTDVDCVSGSPLGDCEVVVSDAGDQSACVCRATEIVLDNLSATGPHALVLLAAATIDVTGALSVSASGAVDGAGASFPYLENLQSGAGGSYGSVGAGDSAMTYGEPSLAALFGGMRGQNGCGGNLGGGGGGALLLVAGERVTVTGTISASGGGGHGGFSNAGCGAGGGSGGAIVVEAPAVVMTGIVAANGGGGGSGGTTSYNGVSGANGSIGTSAAAGGQGQSEDTCILGGTLYSGSGGSGATASQSARVGGGTSSITSCINNTYGGSGGHGGGVGRIRINTESGCLCTGTFSPSPSFGLVTIE